MKKIIIIIFALIYLVFCGKDHDHEHKQQPKQDAGVEEHNHDHGSEEHSHEAEEKTDEHDHDHKGTDPHIWTSSRNNSRLYVGDIITNLATANVSIFTGTAGTQAGNIDLRAALNYAGVGIRTLTLIAANDIDINAAISGAYLHLVLETTATGGRKATTAPGKRIAAPREGNCNNQNQEKRAFPSFHIVSYPPDVPCTAID